MLLTIKKNGRPGANKHENRGGLKNGLARCGLPEFLTAKFGAPQFVSPRFVSPPFVSKVSFLSLVTLAVFSSEMAFGWHDDHESEIVDGAPSRGVASSSMPCRENREDPLVIWNRVQLRTLNDLIANASSAQVKAALERRKRILERQMAQGNVQEVAREQYDVPQIVKNKRRCSL